MATVTLNPAYMWDCDECGTENFCRGIIAEMSEEDLAELREEHGIEEHETGDWMTMPETVVCKVCSAEFETQHFSE